MLQTATIVFREILEIALVLGIVLAATRGLKGQGMIAALGLLIGFTGAALIAFFTDQIAQAIDGVGQEVFNACVLFVAVGFLGWTVVWMKRHAREMARNINQMGQDVMKGKRPYYILIGVVALATFREGAEIVLFTYGMTASGAITMFDVFAGGLAGLAGGTAVGCMLYFGLLKTVKKHLFTVTSWMLIFLTAGMAAQGANFLIAAGMLPDLHPQVWNTAYIIAPDGLLGEVLSVLIGYSARPTGMELVFYVATFLTIASAYKFLGTSKIAPITAPVSVAAAE